MAAQLAAGLQRLQPQLTNAVTTTFLSTSSPIKTDIFMYLAGYQQQPQSDCQLAESLAMCSYGSSMHPVDLCSLGDQPFADGGSMSNGKEALNIGDEQFAQALAQEERARAAWLRRSANEEVFRQTNEFLLQQLQEVRSLTSR